MVKLPAAAAIPDGYKVVSGKDTVVEVDIQGDGDFDYYAVLVENEGDASKQALAVYTSNGESLRAASDYNSSLHLLASAKRYTSLRGDRDLNLDGVIDLEFHSDAQFQAVPNFVPPSPGEADFKSPRVLEPVDMHRVSAQGALLLRRLDFESQTYDLNDKLTPRELIEVMKVKMVERSDEITENWMTSMSLIATLFLDLIYDGNDIDDIGSQRREWTRQELTGLWAGIISKDKNGAIDRTHLWVQEFKGAGPASKPEGITQAHTASLKYMMSGDWAKAEEVLRREFKLVVGSSTTLPLESSLKAAEDYALILVSQAVEDIRRARLAELPYIGSDADSGGFWAEAGKKLSGAQATLDWITENLGESPPPSFLVLHQKRLTSVATVLQKLMGSFALENMTFSTFLDRS